jgi:dTDP-4-amino-4,6-dideoxygalactose transaminase
MMKIPPVKVVFSEADKKDILNRISACLSSGMLAQGANVNEFEQNFAKYTGSTHAVAVNTGGAAIEIPMRIYDVANKEVLVPTDTFLATASSVILAGGKVRLVDISPDTFSPSLENLKRRVTKNTAGVIIVHIGGIVTPEMPAIRRWCDENGLWLFEDCAHAHGSRLGERSAGSFGSAGGYSFFATKVITSGEGGVIVTNDEAFAKKAKVLRDYGKEQPWVSYHTHLGANWRMSDITAAVAVVQLARLEEFIAWRDKIATIYTEALRATGRSSGRPVLPHGKCSWYKYIVVLPGGVDRQKLRDSMKAKGVSLSGGVYEIPLHKQPVFAGMEGEFPVAEELCDRHICLPLYYGMTEQEAVYVVDTLNESLREVHQ